MAKQDQSSWWRREAWSMIKPHVPAIVGGTGAIIMAMYGYIEDLPGIVVIPLVIIIFASATVGVALCLKIVWAYQDRKSRKEYGKVVSFPGKRGKRRRWQERIQQLIDRAPSSGDRKEAVRWRNDILEMFENFHVSQSGYAKMLLERMVGLEKNAVVAECIKKAVDYLLDIKDSVF